MSITVTENKNIPVKAGGIIFIQGSPCNSINFLMEGEIEILTTSDKELAEMQEQEIIDRSQRVCTLQENTFFGVDSVLTGQDYNYSIRATKDSTISVYPTEKLSINALIQNKLNYAFLMARSLVKLQQKSMRKIKTLDVFIRDIQRIQDTLGLLFMRLSKSYTLKSQGKLSSYAHELWETFKANNGELPAPLSLKIVKQSYEKVLDKNYGFETNLENQKVNFLYKFFSSPTDLQMKFFQHDPFILKYLAIELGGEISNIMGDIERAYQSFKQEFTHFADEKNNWLLEFSKLFEAVRERKVEADEKLIREILNYLINLTTNVNNKFYKEFNFNLEPSEKVIATVRAKLEAKKGETVEVVEDFGDVPEELEDSLTKILDYTDVEEDFRKKVIKNVSDFRRVEDKGSDDSDIRKLRRTVTDLYWKLYEIVYLKTYKSGDMIPAVELFINFGILDDKLLKNHHLIEIYKEKDTYSSKYPIFYTKQWLDKVFDKKEDPSISELGQSFYEVLRDEHRDKLQGRKLTDVPEELNSGEDRVIFELKNMLRSTVKITTGQPRTAQPILTSDNFWRDVKDMRVTRQRLEKTIDEVLERDFSVFHRQILYKNPERNIYKEFVMKKVVPNFIIVPSAGTNIMMYQELDGKNKSSRGRFAIPAFANAPDNTSQYDDLFLLLLKACAVFRWELLRSLLGHAWTDPTESSLTSDYMDYIQFYKKNAKLSPEAKEKVKTEFKRFRTDRDKYVHDYMQWIINEFDGQMKLNVVVREIFFKHVPFKKEYREKLGKSPRYQDIFTRMTNIKRRDLKKMDNKYFKYTKDGQPLPEELQNNMDFYKF